jgi:hypothetical protein
LFAAVTETLLLALTAGDPLAIRTFARALARRYDFRLVIDPSIELGFARIASREIVLRSLSSLKDLSVLLHEVGHLLSEPVERRARLVARHAHRDLLRDPPLAGQRVRHAEAWASHHGSDAGAHGCKS